MKRVFTIIIVAILAFCLIYWFSKDIFNPKTDIISNHDILIEQIESIGKLELVKYRLSDVIEHKNSTDYLPDASVLLIVKAEAVGCIDLSKINPEDIQSMGDSVTIYLPHPEICYVKIDHSSSKVYDTKMAFFREADLVDEAYKYAEIEINKQVRKSDILQQTRNNAQLILKPLIESFGFKKVTLMFK